MMPEELRGFEITSGGVCRICGQDRFVLVARFHACLTCVLNEIAEDEDEQRRKPPTQRRRRNWFVPRGAPPLPPRRRLHR